MNENINTIISEITDIQSDCAKLAFDLETITVKLKLYGIQLKIEELTDAEHGITAADFDIAVNEALADLGKTAEEQKDKGPGRLLLMLSAAAAYGKLREVLFGEKKE